MNDADDDPKPNGELTLSSFALPRDANGDNRVYAGWISSQMDLAAAAAAERYTQSSVVTVAISSMSFVSPVKLGSQIGFYTKVLDVGRTSVKIQVDVWAHKYNESQSHKVTEAEFILVAVDDKGRTQAIRNTKAS